MTQLEFFYDYSCPYAYLASTQIEALAERTGASLEYKPFLLGGVFKALGDAAGDMQKLGPARARMNVLDMRRWAEHWRVPLSMPSGHPNRTVLALRATLASGDIRRASQALFRAYWAEARNLSDPDVVSDALSKAGFDGAALIEKAEQASIKDELRSRTDEAVRRGVFGAPSLFVNDELYWGQDRLDFVERALGGTPPAVPAIENGPRVAEFEFFYDFSSPFAYLASTQVEALAVRAGARILWRPFLLGALFKAIGTADVPIFTFSEAKRAHTARDLARFSELYRVPFRFISRFPMRSVLPLRVALAAGDAIGPLTTALFRAAWADDRDLADDATLREMCRTLGLEESLLDRTNEDSVKLALRQNTERAVALGIVGAPSFVVGEHVFWGQDRLGFVERALAGWRPGLTAREGEANSPPPHRGEEHG